jgi:hypothetical protein
MARERAIVVCSSCEGSGKTKGVDRRLNLVEKTCVHCMGKGQRTVMIRKGSRAPRLERSDLDANTPPEFAAWEDNKVANAIGVKRLPL